MRYYKINRSGNEGGIYLGPTKQDSLTGILLCFSPRVTCNPFNWPHEDEWISLGFIDLSHPQPDMGYVMLSNGKTNALESFTGYLLRLGIRSRPNPYEAYLDALGRMKLYQRLMHITLQKQYSRDGGHSWYSYSIDTRPHDTDLLDLMAKVVETNDGVVPPLLNPDPKVRAYFPPPMTTEALLSFVCKGMDTKQDPPKESTTLPPDIDIQDMVYLDRMKGISWD